ncbi:MAG: VWA domain-containing protein [Planctomycetaceae bacterium]|nr:VWA domain-containing protein [Planctomycetaceae bacterium]
MEFLNPIAGFLALLALPIILFYILKVRLRQESVSTILFWQQVFEERRTRSLWRRLRHLLSLIVSLLFLSLLVAALLHPVFKSQGRESRTVIIVDNSASMNAKESASATRLDLAKAELLRYIAGTDAARQTAIITAGGEPQVVTGFTNHLGTLRKKAAEIRSTDFPTELEKAMELASRLTANEPDSAVLVYTDGGMKDLEKYLSAKDVRFIPIGKPLDNVAITQFQPRRSLGDVVGYEILAEVANFSETKTECRLEIDLNGMPVEVIPLSLEPNQTITQIVRCTSEQGGVLKASLKKAEEKEPLDAFPLDDTAIAVLPARPIQKLLFYGEADFFLGHVLQWQPNIELTVLTECPAVVPDDSVLIAHRTVPAAIPKGNVFLIDPQNDSDFCGIGETIESPLAANEEKESPLMRFVHLTNVLIPGVKRLTPQFTEAKTNRELSAHADAEDHADVEFSVLASTPEEYPIYLRWQTSDRKVLLFSGELKRGDLALRTAFPIMISNALNDFRGSGGEIEKAYSTAEPITISLSSPRHAASAALPKSVVLKQADAEDSDSQNSVTPLFPVKSGRVSLGTLPQCGLWEIAAAEENAQPLQQLACNLANAEESHLRSAPESFYAQQREKVTHVAAGRPIWFWLVVAAIILTTAEWFLYQRRWMD